MPDSLLATACAVHDTVLPCSLSFSLLDGCGSLTSMCCLRAAPFYDEEREDSKNNFAGKVRAVKDGAAKEFVVSSGFGGLAA